MTSPSSHEGRPPARWRTTDEIFSTLDVWEIPWRDRQPFLQSRGYMLRPRYHPNWIPSWRTTNDNIYSCEDAIAAPAREHLMDARRIVDDVPVYIKRVKTGDTESEITTMLSSGRLRQDTRNHSVPVLDMFPDDADPGISYMVMPLLRLIDDPAFYLVEELVEFIDQILEGLEFMHEHGVAHRDCTHKNLMMDASAMYPQGFHPVHETRLPDGRTKAHPHLRASVSVRYYFIDYGLSDHLPADVHPRLVIGDDGRDQEVPELSAEVPYDPFKVDIYIMGNLFRRMFYDQYTNVDFLMALFQPMVQNDPFARPDAVAVRQKWLAIRPTVSALKRRWRLRPRREPWPETAMYEAYTLVLAGLHFRGYVVAACIVVAAIRSGLLR